MILRIMHPSLAALLAAALAVGCSNEQTAMTSTTVPKKEDPKSNDPKTKKKTPIEKVEEGSEVDDEEDEAAVELSDESSRHLSRDFSTTRYGDFSALLSPADNGVRQEIKLSKVYESISEVFTQESRTVVTSTMKQGTSAANRSESFGQNQLGQVDIQIIIDDSPSMKQEQDSLSANLPQLLSKIDNSDWRINIATTSHKNGCSRALIKRGDADAAAMFYAGIRAGTKGSGKEEGIRMAVEGLRCPQANNWVRPQSTVVVIIVSDEDNCSKNSSGCKNDPWKNHTYLTNDFLARAKNATPPGLGRTLGADARVYAIVRPSNNLCTKALSVGTQYVAAANQTSGLVGEICAATYAPILNQISNDISTLLKAQFEFSVEPNPASVQVRVNNVVAPAADYRVNGKTLEFIRLPPFGASIQASYLAKALEPIKTVFSLGTSIPAGRAVVAGSMVVKVNGQVAPTSSYAFNAASKDLTFVDPPADLADITVSFRIDDKSLAEAFMLASNAVKPGSLTVKINGQATNNVSLSGASLRPQSLLLDGQVMEVSYMIDRGPVLKYPVSLGAGATYLKTIDKTSGQDVMVTVADGDLTVGSADFVEGRVLVVKGVNLNLADGTFSLANVPISGTLQVVTGREDCKFGNEIQLTGTVPPSLTLACVWAGGDTVSIQYKYLDAPQRTFIVDGIENPEVGHFRVFVDGFETEEYSRDGESIQLSNPPPQDAIVTITYTVRA